MWRCVFRWLKEKKLVREGGYTITGGRRFSCSNPKIAPPMPKSVSGKPIMLTGAGVYNEGAGRRAGKCRQACSNNDLRLGKQ